MAKISLCSKINNSNLQYVYLKQIAFVSNKICLVNQKTGKENYTPCHLYQFTHFNSLIFVSSCIFVMVSGPRVEFCMAVILLTVYNNKTCIYLYVTVQEHIPLSTFTISSTATNTHTRKTLSFCITKTNLLMKMTHMDSYGIHKCISSNSNIPPSCTLQLDCINNLIPQIYGIYYPLFAMSLIYGNTL